MGQAAWAAKGREGRSRVGPKGQKPVDIGPPAWTSCAGKNRFLHGADSCCTGYQQMKCLFSIGLFKTCICQKQWKRKSLLGNKKGLPMVVTINPGPEGETEEDWWCCWLRCHPGCPTREEHRCSTGPGRGWQRQRRRKKQCRDTRWRWSRRSWWWMMRMISRDQTRPSQIEVALIYSFLPSSLGWLLSTDADKKNFKKWRWKVRKWEWISGNVQLTKMANEDPSSYTSTPEGDFPQELPKTSRIVYSWCILGIM